MYLPQIPMKKLFLYLPGFIALSALTPVSFVTAQDAPAEPAAEAKVHPPVSLPDPVAIVEGEKISRDELQTNFNNILANANRPVSSLTTEQQLTGYHRILEDMIIEKILDKKVSGTKVNDAEVEEGMKEIRAQFPSEEVMKEQIEKSGQSMEKVREAVKSGVQKQKWIEAQVEDEVKVTSAEAEEFYKSQPDSFKVPETVRASHILIQTPEGASDEVLAEKKKAIDSAAARLKKGEDFAAVAKEVSEDPGSKEKGGDLDFFAKDRMVPEFADAAWKLKKDEVSEPVKSQFGYHIIKLTDRKEAREVPFSEASERITGYLQEQKRREAIQKLVMGLREKADVKVMLPPIPKQDAPAQPAAEAPAQSAAPAATPGS